MDKYNRSSNYRHEFFKYNKGIFGSNKYYHCSYCGKILPKDKITVDHIIPVHKVSKRGYARFLMKLRGIDNINDISNLIPACSRCNSKKSAQLGGWVLRGDIGRHFTSWIIIRGLEIVLFILLLQFSFPHIVNVLFFIANSFRTVFPSVSTVLETTKLP